MAERCDASGQTLVELALVLPCFCLGIFMAVQLICYCHNMVELQRMAQVMADRQNEEHRSSSRDYWKFHALWGRFKVHQIKSSSERPQPWRPFRGISTTHQPGWLMHVRVGADLLPGDGFSHGLDRVNQQGYADTFLEPPIPLEE